MPQDLSNIRCVVLVDPDHPDGYALKVVPVSQGDTIQAFSEAAARQGFTIGFAMDRTVTPQQVARYIPGIAKMPGVAFVLDLRPLIPSWPH
jgi:hypothetical protein